MNTYRRILRAAEQSYPHWIALPEGKCIGENFHKLRDFCRDHQLSLSRHGHAVAHKHRYFQVFMFAEEEHAETFCKELRRRVHAPFGERHRQTLVNVEQGDAQAEAAASV